MSTRPSARARALLGAYALAARELKRFIRQRNRVFGALVQPILFWALFGAGLNASFKPSSGARAMSYTEYFFPGTIVLILLFTAIFATISVIEDRNEGFLQSVLAAPIPSSALVIGKLAGATALAVGQAVLFLPMAFIAGVHLTALSFALAVPLLAVIAFSLTGLGFIIAWRLDSTQGFHAIMNAFLMPMWLLSGAFFPSHGVPTVLAWIIALNPLTYGVTALRRILYIGRPEAVSDLPNMSLSLTVVVLFAMAMFAAAYRSVRATGGRR
jgi:ABC-2 type transport system permease protein